MKTRTIKLYPAPTGTLIDGAADLLKAILKGA